MGWFVLTYPCLILVAMVSIGRLSGQEKDLEIPRRVVSLPVNCTQFDRNCSGETQGGDTSGHPTSVPDP
jgi:hypothetical protein